MDEGIPQLPAVLKFGLRPMSADVRQAAKAVEVCNGGGFSVDRIKRRRAKDVVRPAENRRATGDRNRRERSLCFRQPRSPQGTESSADDGGPGSIARKLPA